MTNGSFCSSRHWGSTTWLHLDVAIALPIVKDREKSLIALHLLIIPKKHIQTRRGSSIEFGYLSWCLSGLFPNHSSVFLYESQES